LKPPPFAYADPRTLEEALQTLADYGDEGKVLAGGQSLVPLLNMRLAQPRVLVDLNRVEALSYIRPEKRDGTPGIAVGAMTRQQCLEESAEIVDLPLVREGIAWVGHPQIRNRGTVGGSVAHADPAGELPLIFRALDGVATVRSVRGSRAVPASECFLYTFTTALEPDEVLTDIWLPCRAPRTGQAFLEVARRHGDFALVAVAASLTLDPHGHMSAASIAVGGAAPVPVRTPTAEQALLGERAGLDLFRAAAALAAAELEPSGDIHADAEYRREAAATLISRALTIAFERAPKDDA
jgi:CO/xanthine dehydrogenase FAD-binding subunit